MYGEVDGVRICIKDLDHVIYGYGRSLAADYDPEDIENEDGDPGGDIRLQVVDGSWMIHTGDACYDDDHRGWWGYAFVPAGCSHSQSKDIARELIDGALDHYCSR